MLHNYHVNYCIAHLVQKFLSELVRVKDLLKVLQNHTQNVVAIRDYLGPVRLFSDNFLLTFEIVKATFPLKIFELHIFLNHNFAV